MTSAATCNSDSRLDNINPTDARHMTRPRVTNRVMNRSLITVSVIPNRGRGWAWKFPLAPCERP